MIALVKNVALPVLAAVIVHFLPLKTMSYVLQVALALAIVVPLGPMIYRLAYQPLAEASCWCC
jgi:hypothetical protein